MWVCGFLHIPGFESQPPCMADVLTVWQPLYFPTLHYFNRLSNSDVFVIFDDAEFSRRSRQHRTPIEFQNNRWLTIPVPRDIETTPINETPLDMQQPWPKRHLGTLEAKYGGAAPDVFEQYYKILTADSTLSEITVPLLEKVMDIFDITVDVFKSSELDVTYVKGEASSYNARLTDELDCDTYYCGQNAYKSYLDETEFTRRDIEIQIQDWDPQWPDGNVICLDPIFGSSNPRDAIQ